MKSVKTWILIANGSRARIVINEGVGRGVTAVAGKFFNRESQKGGDIMADRPGRTFNSEGTGRHAMEYSSDPVRERERSSTSTSWASGRSSTTRTSVKVMRRISASSAS